jgi:hypothetical protein
LNPQLQKADDRFVIAMSLSFVLGMAVGLATYLLWKLNAVPVQLHGVFNTLALVVCPPFILSYVAAATPDSGMATALVSGTVVMANAFLYTGVAAGIYHVVILWMSKRRRA